MTNTNITIEDAIAQYEDAVENEYVVDGKIDRNDVWMFTDLLTATEVLLAVVTENDDDEEAVELFSTLANLDNGVKKVARLIVADDYILGDWTNVSDYHEYNEFVMDIVKDVVSAAE